MVALRAGSATDVGRVRSNNQDSFLLADPLYAVADGMGGAAAGEVASSVAVEALGNGFTNSGPPTPDSLVDAAHAANRAVWDEAEANPEMRGMGTTLVAVALVSGDQEREERAQLAIINIGDSRLYVLHNEQLRQITYDHNLVAEMVAQGRITPAEAEVHPRRNIMTRALGVEPEVPVDLFVEAPVIGDRYLLCSDGLPREVSDDAIRSLLSRFADPSEAARELVDEALRRGGNDNITVVVVDVVGDDDDDATRVVATAPGPDTDGTVAMPRPAMTAATADQTQAVPLVGPTDDTADDTADAPTDDTADDTSDGPPKKPARPVRRLVTVRVVMFVLLLLIIIVAAGAGVVWYARATYYVGLKGNEIVVFQGRPGGVLGLNPTEKEDTHFNTAQVLTSALPTLQSGQEESSLAAANSYVTSLIQAYDDAQQADEPSTTTSTSTTTPRATTARRATTTAKP